MCVDTYIYTGRECGGIHSDVAPRGDRHCSYKQHSLA